MMEVKGRQIRCLVCGHDHFDTRNAQLNTSVASFFNMDWANKTAICLVCADCSHIMWFLGD